MNEGALTKTELSNLIVDFCDGTCGAWDWDDFVSYSHKDLEIENWRNILSEFDVLYPSGSPNEYCNAEGRAEMLRIAKILKGELMS